MNTIYVRTLKRAEHTVFAVEDGQKNILTHNLKGMFPIRVANR